MRPKGANRAIRTRSAALEQQIIDDYRAAWQIIAAEIQALGVQVKAAQAAGETVDRGWLVKRSRLEEIEREIRGRIEVVAHDTTLRTAQAITAAELAAHVDAEALIRAALGAGPPGFLLRPAERFIRRASEGALADLFAGLGEQAGRTVRQRLLAGLLAGRGPRVLARQTRSALGGNMARALTIARTETLRAYRETVRETYAANDDVVTGWVWQAELDARTCEVCWAMHGQVFDTDEEQDTHPNCRCTMIPQTKSWNDLGFPGFGENALTVTPGPELFAALPEAEQRAVLGPGKLAAYKQGRIALPDLVARTRGPHGGGRRTRSLADLLSK